MYKKNHWLPTWKPSHVVVSFRLLKPCLNRCFRNKMGLQKQDHGRESRWVGILETPGAIFELHALHISGNCDPYTHTYTYSPERRRRRNDNITCWTCQVLYISSFFDLIGLNLIFTTLWEWYFNSICTCKKTEAHKQLFWTLLCSKHKNLSSIFDEF